MKKRTLLFVLVMFFILILTGLLYYSKEALFYKSTEELDKLSWTSLSRPLGGTITGFAWSQSDPGVIYLATDPNDLGVWKSEDFGKTWDQVYHDDHTYSIAAHPTIKNYILIGDKIISTSRLMKSYDGGKNREEVMDLPGRVNQIVFYERNPDIVAFVNNGDRTPVHISHDGGHRFIGKDVRVDEDEFENVRVIAFDPSDANIIYISVDIGQLLISRDQGDSWERLFTAYLSNANKSSEDEWRQRAAINKIAIDGSVVYLATNDGVFVSKDKGRNWKNSGLKFANDIQIVGGSIYVAAQKGVYKSRDDGINWERISDFDADYILVDKNNESRMVIAPSSWVIPHSYWWQDDIIVSSQDIYEYDGVYYSEDGGETWHQGRHFYHTDLVETYINGDLMFAGASCGRGAFISKDAGNSWQFMEIIDKRATGGGNVMHYSMDIYADNEVVIMTGGDGSVISYDNGSTWELIPIESHSHGIFKSKDIILIGQSSWGSVRPDVPGATVWRSEDMGKSWNASSEGFPKNAQTEIHSFVEDGKGTIYFSTHFWTDGTEGIGVYRSLNRGGTWEEFNVGLKDLDIAAIEVAYGTLYASNHHGLHVNENGAWRKISSIAFRDLEYDSNNKVFYGSEWGRFLRSYDGVKWKELQTPWSKDTHVKRIRISGGKMYVATNNEGIFVANL